jgi:hypothetical protein
MDLPTHMLTKNFSQTIRFIGSSWSLHYERTIASFLEALFVYSRIKNLHDLCALILSKPY